MATEKHIYSAQIDYSSGDCSSSSPVSSELNDKYFVVCAVVNEECVIWANLKKTNKHNQDEAALTIQHKLRYEDYFRDVQGTTGKTAPDVSSSSNSRTKNRSMNANEPTYVLPTTLRAVACRLDADQSSAFIAVGGDDKYVRLFRLKQDDERVEGWSLKLLSRVGQFDKRISFITFSPASHVVPKNSAAETALIIGDRFGQVFRALDQNSLDKSSNDHGAAVDSGDDEADPVGTTFLLQHFSILTGIFVYQSNRNKALHLVTTNKDGAIRVCDFSRPWIIHGFLWEPLAAAASSSTADAVGDQAGDEVVKPPVTAMCQVLCCHHPGEKRDAGVPTHAAAPPTELFLTGLANGSIQVWDLENTPDLGAAYGTAAHRLTFPCPAAAVKAATTKLSTSAISTVDNNKATWSPMAATSAVWSPIVGFRVAEDGRTFTVYREHNYEHGGDEEQYRVMWDAITNRVSIEAVVQEGDGARGPAAAASSADIVATASRVVLYKNGTIRLCSLSSSSHDSIWTEALSIPQSLTTTALWDVDRKPPWKREDMRGEKNEKDVEEGANKQKDIHDQANNSQSKGRGGNREDGGRKRGRK